MKKFLAIVFSLIFALSACTVAFATNYECEVCHAVLGDEKAYTAHINGGCLVKFTDCQYCAARVDRNHVEEHEGNCPKGAAACKLCGETFGTQNLLKAHADKACKCAACGKEVPAKDKTSHKCEITDKVVNTVTDEKTWETLANKAIDALKTVDWAGLANKVVDAVKGIDFQGLIAKIKPVIEKVVELVKGFAA